MSGAPAAGKPAQPLYFINGAVDVLLIGGLSILTLIAMYFGGFTRDVPAYVDGKGHWITNLTLLLMVVCNWPHFAASSYRLSALPHAVERSAISDDGAGRAVGRVVVCLGRVLGTARRRSAFRVAIPDLVSLSLQRADHRRDVDLFSPGRHSHR